MESTDAGQGRPTPDRQRRGAIPLVAAALAIAIGWGQGARQWLDHEAPRMAPVAVQQTLEVRTLVQPEERPGNRGPRTDI